MFSFFTDDKDEAAPLETTPSRSRRRREPGVLSLTDRGLKELPASDITDGDVPTRAIDLSRNAISELNPSLPFHKLYALMTLDLSHNRIAALPAFDWAKLSVLRVSHNQLSAGSVQFSASGENFLEHLDLSFNRLKTLPQQMQGAAMRKWRRLKGLCIQVGAD